MKKIILTLIISVAALLLGSGKSLAAPVMSEASDTVVVKATGGPKTVVLVNAGENKVKVIKILREYLGIGLKETHALVNTTPAIIKKEVPEEEAADLAASLKEVGAEVELKEAQ